MYPLRKAPRRQRIFLLRPVRDHAPRGMLGQQPAEAIQGGKGASGCRLETYKPLAHTAGVTAGTPAPIGIQSLPALSAGGDRLEKYIHGLKK